jgi:hypothetical protein
MLQLMTTLTEDKVHETKPAKSTHDAITSTHGKWRSFPKVPNLLQFINTGVYFGRLNIEGKIFRESLGTNVFITAKILFGDFLKKKRKQTSRPNARNIWRDPRALGNRFGNRLYVAGWRQNLPLKLH